MGSLLPGSHRRTGHCCRDDRLLVVLALLKSAALKGKGCLLVAKPADAYRLRMFLDTFGIRAALCHDAMPAKSREHAAQVSCPAWPARVT